MSKFSYPVKPEDAGRSVKEILRRNFSFSSRMMTRFKRENCILLNGSPVKVNTPLDPGDIISIDFPDETSHFLPEDVPIIPVFEDDDLLIINKPAGYVVHPTKGHPAHTVANGLARYITDSGRQFKIRFVNRLDMDTSGLLVIAKNAHAQEDIAKQMRQDRVIKKYLAVVQGIIKNDSGMIDAPIGHPDPEKVSRGVIHSGQPSKTFYTTLERYEKGYSLAELQLKTGRTHQIRVHMAHIGHPVAGDRLYGGENVPLIGRQALHAHFISFFHPITEKQIEVSAEMPDDMLKLLAYFRNSST